jgi:tRNA-modifying protein YgfZ
MPAARDRRDGPGTHAAPDAETAALRTGVGAFTAYRDVIAVRGPDAESYLQGQLSQDVDALAVGAAKDALLLQPDGKLAALLRVTRTDGRGFLLDVEGGYGSSVAERLRRFLLRTKVELEHLDWRCLCLRGQAVKDTAAAGMLAVLAERGVLTLPFEWNGWAGVDVLGPRDTVLDTSQLPEGMVPCGPAAVEACRIASGIPAMGAELTEKTIAAETGLVERTVDFDKGCYTGQELVARIASRGSNVARRLVGVVAADARPGGEPLARGMTLHAGEPPTGHDPASDKVVGTVTSAAWSSELGAQIALAYLHRSVEAPGPVRVRSGDGTGGSRPARVAPLPLVGVEVAPGPG